MTTNSNNSLVEKIQKEMYGQTWHFTLKWDLIKLLWENKFIEIAWLKVMWSNLKLNDVKWKFDVIPDPTWYYYKEAISEDIVELWPYNPYPTLRWKTNYEEKTPFDWE